MAEPRHIIGLSGGKDSTAMALLLTLFFPGPRYEFICTPTGNELPTMTSHWAKLERLLGAPLKRLTGGTDLLGLIEQMQMLPNFSARWCTRILKIEPTIEFMESLPPGSTLYVGLRADEDERERASSGRTFASGFLSGSGGSMRYTFGVRSRFSKYRSPHEQIAPFATGNALGNGSPCGRNTPTSSIGASPWKRKLGTRFVLPNATHGPHHCEGYASNSSRAAYPKAPTLR